MAPTTVEVPSGIAELTPQWLTGALRADPTLPDAPTVDGRITEVWNCGYEQGVWH
ncbi:hypothetical protein [Mycobacterium sp. IS-1496]|uniref:hypothetical protein n=1 Tax=Mycobacterium sp. IS-1496 TaxID=1772284 RepID=UPI000A41552F|nr:hypothetical protein [Mycobacterium sp. IS-1496]